MPAKSRGSYYWEQTKVIQDALAVLAEFNIKYEDLFVDLYYVIAPPVTKIWCADSQPCKIQLASLMPSFKFTYEQQGIKMVTGVRSVVSTKRKGGFKVGIETQTASKTIIADTVYGLSISKGMKSYSYKRDEYADFNSFSEIEEKRKLVQHKDYKGNYGHYHDDLIIAVVNPEEIAAAIINGKIQMDDKLEMGTQTDFEPVSSANGDDDEFYFPEFTATLSKKGGIYTLNNIDDSGMSNLTKWLIVGFSTALAIILVVFSILCYIHVIKPCRAGNNYSSFSTTEAYDKS